MLHALRGLSERFAAAGSRKIVGESFRAVGGCRCPVGPVRYEYTRPPLEVHYCCCSDCTAVCGGALALIAVIDRAAFKLSAGERKIRNFDTGPGCHRRFCGDCGCHMFLYVDAFPDFVLVHVPTLDRESEVGTAPDRWVFTNSKHPLVTIPDDGLPRHSGWANSTNAG